MFDEDDFDMMCELRAEAARLFVPVDDGWDDELSDLDIEQ